MGREDERMRYQIKMRWREDEVGRGGARGMDGHWQGPNTTVNKRRISRSFGPVGSGGKGRAGRVSKALNFGDSAKGGCFGQRV